MQTTSILPQQLSHAENYHSGIIVLKPKIKKKIYDLMAKQ